MAAVTKGRRDGIKTPSSDEFVVVKNTDIKNGLLIIDKPNGHLYCGTCKLNWCDHIHDVVRNNKDADALMSRFTLNEIDAHHIDVAIVPSEDLWAQVILVRSPELPRALEVQFSITNPETRNKLFGKDGKIAAVFLGLINPGEGRMVIRSMIYDWFAGQAPQLHLKCTSTFHSVAAEVMWQQDHKKNSAPVRTFMQEWSVFMSGRCLGCNQPSQTDFSDLIPEDEKTRPW